MTALLFVFLFGPGIIQALKLRQGRGQPIRADGPQTHLAKAGTPTMGGLDDHVGRARLDAALGEPFATSMSGRCFSSPPASA